MRLLVLLAALAGLFAMHGMSDHGTMHPGSPEAHASAALMAAGDLDPVSRVVADDVLPAAGLVALDGVALGPRAGVPAVEGHGAVDAGLHAAMGLCLAILGAAAVLALRRLRTWSYQLTRGLAHTGQRVLDSRARAPDPPNLYVLSIQRC